MTLGQLNNLWWWDCNMNVTLIFQEKKIIFKKWTLLFIIVTCRYLEAKFKYLKISFGQYIFFCIQKFVLNWFSSYNACRKVLEYCWCPDFRIYCVIVCLPKCCFQLEFYQISNKLVWEDSWRLAKTGEFKSNMHHIF